jgi:hypothetical protein
MNGFKYGLMAAAFTAVIASAGCDASALPYFLAGCPEPMDQAGDMALVPDKKKRDELKIMVLAYSAMEPSTEFVTVDRELQSSLSRQLLQLAKKNEEKVAMISPGKVQEYKNAHPDWHTSRIEDIGRQFHADYVIYLEIESMTLFERGGFNQLYRGRAEIGITLVNLQKPDMDPIEKHFSCEYPKTRGPVPVDEMNARQFYLSFMESVTKKLSWYFVPHESQEDYCD